MQRRIPIENPGEPTRTRLWRRAVVLTGSHEGGARVVGAILREEPTLDRMSETRLEQRVIQLARQWRREEPALTMGEPVPAFAPGTPGGELAERLDGLSAGLRESWLLCAGFGLEPEAVALMLGESTAAVESRLDEVASECSDDGAPISVDATESVRDQIRSLAMSGGASKLLDAAATRGRARRRRASVLWVLAMLLVLTGLVLILRDLMGWDETQAEREKLIRERSNLIPSDEPEDAGPAPVIRDRAETDAGAADDPGTP